MSNTNQKLDLLTNTKACVLSAFCGEGTARLYYEYKPGPIVTYSKEHKKGAKLTPFYAVDMKD